MLSPVAVARSFLIGQHPAASVSHSRALYFVFRGHVGCFQRGALMNEAALNILTRVFGGYVGAFLLDVYFGVEWLGPRAFARSALGDASRHLSKVFVLVTLPPEMRVSGDFTLLPILAAVNLFSFSLSIG